MLSVVGWSEFYYPEDCPPHALLTALRFIEQNGIKGYEFGPGCATPDYVLLKEFFRWYGHTARGKKSKNGRPVMTSFLNCAERLFGGFEEELQIKIVMEDRSEIYNVSFC